MNFDLSQFTGNQVYHLITQTLIPRPIAWVLTESGEVGSENYNLAPFSYFTALSSDPALLLMSIGKKPDGEEKDTLLNAKTNGKMVIHIAPDNLYQDVTNSAATLPHGESELQQSDLTLSEFEGWDLPRLTECDIAFACTTHEIQQIKDAPQQLLIVKVEKVYVSERVSNLDDKGRPVVNAAQVKPLSRLGAAQYATFGEIVSQQRPK